jgi:hypothetical protein
LTASLLGTREAGGDNGVAFFAFFFGEAKKKVARRGQSRLGSPKKEQS